LVIPIKLEVKHIYISGCEWLDAHTKCNENITTAATVFSVKLTDMLARMGLIIK
jgi:hypothetical protein